MAAKVILVEAQPALVATGAATTVRLAGGGAVKPFNYGGQDWRAGVIGMPTLIASLDYEGGEFPNGSVPAAAAIDWGGSSRALLSMLAGYMWADAPITVRIGAEGDALPAVALSGKVLEAKSSNGRLSIALADPATAIRKPLLTERYAGTGGLEGPVEWDGEIRRRVWGRVWNLAGDPIDKANNIYCFADPLRPIQAFDALRDKGAAAAAINVLAWQGSAAATFAALQAAVAPAGGGVACPSIACVKWWTQPAGELCADLRGEVGVGYVETTAAIAQRLVEAIAGPAFAAGTVAAANLARPASVGWVARDDSTTVAAMLDELLGNSSLLWLLDDSGQIAIRPWTWGASVAVARSEDVERKQVLRPLATRRLGYKRNETRMARGDLAGIVLVDDIAYADGTPLADQVAEALATAQAKGKVTIGGPLPALNSSAPGDTHVGDDGVFYERVNEGGILLGGFAIVLGGFRPRIGWTLSRAQPLRGAVAQAGQAQQTADAALTALSDLADDGVLSVNEKVVHLIPDNARLEGAWLALVAAAAAANVSTSAAAAKRSAWLALRNGLAPAWDDTTRDTPVDRLTYRAALVEYDQALEDLNKAVLEGITAARQVTVAPPSDVVIFCDQAGTPKSGQLGRVITPSVLRGGTDIRTSNDVSYSISAPAQVAATVNNTTASADKGRITIGTGWSGPGTISLTVTVAGVPYGPFPIAVTRQNDAPAAPGGGGGGAGPAYDSSFNPITSASFVAISDELGPLSLTSGQKLVVTAPLDYSLSASSSINRYMVAKAQYWDGSTWLDFPGSPVNGSAATWSTDDFSGDPGSISLSQEKTGLATGSYKVRLVAALSAGGSSAAISVTSGTMTFSVV